MSKVIRDVLDCEGPRLYGTWRKLFETTAGYESSLAGPYSAHGKVFNITSVVLDRWRPLMLKVTQVLQDVLKGASSPRVLAGFCAHGFITARFWECFDVEPTAYGSDISDCLQSLVTGPVDSDEWGPLEFSESTRWPIKIIDIRLLQEHWSSCATISVSLCEDLSIRELRARAGLYATVPHYEEGATTPRSIVARQLVAQPAIVSIRREALSSIDSLKLVVVGSHVGSNMEPLSLVRACLEYAQIKMIASVYGTAYPWPELICELFGFCARNAHIDEVVSLLVRQMYSPRWAAEDLLATLQNAILGDPVLRNAELVVCAQPMTVCSLLRGLSDTPMLLYQAFPLIGATPAALHQVVLLQFREMFRNPSRSAFVVYSEFLASQLAHQMGQRPLCIRPHSLYVKGITYDPDRKNPRIAVSRIAGWAREGAYAFVHLTEAFANRDLRPGTALRFVFLGMSREPSDTVAGISSPFGYYELRRFRAAVFIPWDFGMLLFSEMYNIGVPLLVPSRRWMAALIKRMLEYTDFGWWQARSNTAVLLPGGNTGENVTTLWPWLHANSSISQILALYDQTDFVRWPYVESFAGLPDLMNKLLELKYDETSQAMRSWNEAAMIHSIAITSKALGALLIKGTSELPVPGESSCV